MAKNEKLELLLVIFSQLSADFIFALYKKNVVSGAQRLGKYFSSFFLSWHKHTKICIVRSYMYLSFTRVRFMPSKRGKTHGQQAHRFIWTNILLLLLSLRWNVAPSKNRQIRSTVDRSISPISF